MKTMDCQQDEKDDSGIEQDHQFIYVRIHVEDHHLQKVLKFNLDDTIWKAKQKVLQVLVKELSDSSNYGLYLPSFNGRAGKFLDESRCLKEYPLNGPVSYLEFKYKRRVYKSAEILQKNIHLKSNKKKFIELIKTNQVSKVARYLDKGFDPNFHISDYETPLICACVDLLEPRSMIMTLVNGGAHLDFRTRKQNLTPLHRSAQFSRKEAIVTLLELGASANVYDENNLTPLYLSITTNEIDSSYCCLLLLQDHSIVNCRNESNSSELHEACRLGLVQHVEHLLFYRCDINSQDNQGNTPLHICSMTNQENCARILLYRGANLQIKNNSNKTALDLCLIHENNSIKTLIESHRIENIVPFVDLPLINPKRRSIYFDTKRGRSSSITNSSSLSSTNNRSISMPKLNPSTSIHSYFQQQNNSSRSQSPKSSSLNSDHGFSSQSNSHLSLNSPNNHQDYYTTVRKHLLNPTNGRTAICIQSYKGYSSQQLTVNKGDLVQIVSVSDDGFAEGICKENHGWIPMNCLQDISMLKDNKEMSIDERVVLSRDQLTALILNNEQFHPRTIVLQKGKKGFGFVLRGSRIAGKYFQPSPSFPALQFLDSIEKGSNAEKAGLKHNDFVLEINGINVVSMPHEQCVQIIKRSGDTLALKVITSITNSPIYQQNLSTQSFTFYQKGDEIDARFNEYEYGSMIVPSSVHSEETSSLSKKENELESIEIKIKPQIPERDSSLYETKNVVSSSTEGDEECSLSSSSTSNQLFKLKNDQNNNLTNSSSNKMSTFKRNSSEKREIEISSPPEAPPLPNDFHLQNSNNTKLIESKNDFQCEIEQAKNRLKKCNDDKCNFPPPPSPRTLRRSADPTSKLQDPRLDANFASVIAQRAAESKARRHENPFRFEFNSNGLPPATTFFNNCVTTSRNQQTVPIHIKNGQRFSTTANELLENLKRRGTNK